MSLVEPNTVIERLQYLPIFPLPDTVLIPGALLPLQVIDARHRRLVQDCLARDRLLAVVLLAPSWGEGLSICRTAGVGYIQSHHELDDGRILILIEGRMRARIIEELHGPEPYLVARATLLEEELGTSHAEIFASVQALRHLVVQLTRMIPDGSGQALALLCASEQDSGLLADLIAARLLSEPLQRQHYLEETSVIRRLDFMVGVIAEVIRALAGVGGAALLN